MGETWPTAKPSSATCREEFTASPCQRHQICFNLGGAFFLARLQATISHAAPSAVFDGQPLSRKRNRLAVSLFRVNPQRLRHTLRN